MLYLLPFLHGDDKLVAGLWAGGYANKLVIVPLVGHFVSVGVVSGNGLRAN